MKLRALLSLTFFLLASVPATAQTDKVDDYVKAEMEKRRIPGMTLAVTRDGKVVKHKAYGLANIELNVPAAPETLYQIASTTKTFTATAIMTLVEEGKLALDDKVSKWLPEIPPAWGGVTVRHCLTHTSGLPDIMEHQCASEPIAETREEALKKLAGMPVLSKPGETWSYNQTGYMLLGMIIEKITGMAFEDFLQRRFFQPLAMTSTRFGDYKKIIAGRASLYTRLESCIGGEPKLARDKIYSAQPAYTYRPYTHTGAGINTTAGDLVKWNLALDEEKVLKKATLDQMWTATKLEDGNVFRFGGTAGFANGWIVDDKPGHKSVGHSGGGSTAYWRFLDDKLNVIVLTNCQGSDPDSLAQGVAALYVPEIAEGEN
jgi:CubicO group peptidase (beta-lactamase class C family)